MTISGRDASLGSFAPPPPACEPGPHEARSVAGALREAADLLAAQDANPFRVAAYRKAAEVVESHAEGLRARFEREGRAGLEALPAIGPGIAGAIAEMLVTGHWALLERLHGNRDPAQAFRAVPGIGPALSHRLHDQLGADTFESLAAAAQEGRLEHVRGMGPRRIAALRAVLAQMLEGRSRRRGRATAAKAGPSARLLLDVDREYRDRAQRAELPRIAPRRFNPEGEAWLPVLHTRRGPWHLTALYSNTARAHELGRDHDWVIVYAYDGDHRERQYTVVTERRGPLTGRRVVRGMEGACLGLYERSTPAGPGRRGQPEGSPQAAQP